MRLIDADKLLERLPKVDFEHDVKISKSGAIIDFSMLVLDSDVVDTVPVRHGKWVRDVLRYHHCSQCLKIEIMTPYFLKKYCPNCGAKMDAR